MCTHYFSMRMQSWQRAKQDTLSPLCLFCVEVTSYAHALSLCHLSLYRWITTAVRASLPPAAARSSTTKPGSDHPALDRVATISRYPRVGRDDDGENRASRDE